MAGEQFIPSKDGTQLYVKQFHAVQPKAQVLILHGYLEHCLRYTEFAEYLNGQGISVTTYDFRGHGKSGGDRPVIRKWEEYEHDLEAVRATLNPQLPTFVLGHSNGGLCTLHYFLTHAEHKFKNLHGIILSNPYVAASDTIPWIILGVVHALGRWVPKLKVPSNLKAADLTSDPLKQKEHDEDQHCQPDASIGWASQGLQAQACVRKLVETTPLSMSVLYVYSTHDKVANAKVVQAVGEKLQSNDKTVIRRDGEQHEVLNESKRVETYEIISGWVLQHV